MIRPLVHDPLLLARKSVPATKEDLETARDLLDTLVSHKDACVGMAANMIGEPVAIIAYDNEGVYEEVFNPVLLKAAGPYQTEEGCLSHEGVRPVKRYKTIKVQWQDRLFRTRIKNFTGFTAQIIQHELDHLNGTLI